MLGNDRNVAGATDHTADGFAEYFTHKVNNIRAATANTRAPVNADMATSLWSLITRGWSFILWAGTVFLGTT